MAGALCFGLFISAYYNYICPKFQLLNPTNKISAVIITYNEIDHIEACVATLYFADEIIVVDSFSNDGTWEWLSANPKIRAFQHPFENFTKQKSYALSLTQHEWVYFIDADERVTPALQEEILNVVNKSETFDAYWNIRAFMFQNKRLYFSGWQTDKVYRLFKKSKCRFIEERIVHETLEVDGKIGCLKEKLIHYSYKDYFDYKGKMLRYGQLKAREEIQKGKRWTLAHQILRPSWKFINHFILRLGFLDGKKGLIISYLNALGVLERYCEMKRLQSEKI